MEKIPPPTKTKILMPSNKILSRFLSKGTLVTEHCHKDLSLKSQQCWNTLVISALPELG